MKIVQGSDLERVLAVASELGAEAIALPLGSPEADWQRLEEAGLEGWGWHSAARDPEAAERHPEWMHAPQHHEWLRRFAGFTGSHPAVVAPWIGLGTRAAADHALARFAVLPKRRRILMADVQGPPMGCGCGNPGCRSWDNAPGEKVAPSAYEHPELLFPLDFLARCAAEAPGCELVPLLVPECERGVVIDGVEDPDGPGGTDLCQGVGCVSPCATVFWPRLLAAARARFERVGMVLTVDALDKDHPVYGEPRAWAGRAQRHNGPDLLPVIEPVDAGRFESWVVVTDYDQTCWPEVPPPGYVPSVPAVRCCGG